MFLVFFTSQIVFLLHYRYVNAHSQFNTTLDVSSMDIVSLEHIVLTLTFTLENYGREYDYRDFYQELQYCYDDQSEDGIVFKDFDYLDEVSKGSTGCIYDWLGESHPKRGDIKVELESPSGTKSTLLPYRKYDFINAEGYDSWPFMSVHYWGEDPNGTWTVYVDYKSSSGYVSIDMQSFEFYGTDVIPEAVSRIPDTCDKACSYKCAAPGPEYCDACKLLRNASTLQCVDKCPYNTTQYNGYCVDSLTDNTSNSDQNRLLKLIFMVVGGVIFFIICIVLVLSVLVCIIKKRKTRSGYHLIPVTVNDE